MRINNVLKLWQSHGMWLLLTFLIVLFSLLRPTQFFTYATFANILRQASALGMCVVGVAMVQISGATDLSVGPRVALIGIISGNMLLSGIAIWVVIITALILGAVTGALNAILTEALRTYVFVVTIATMNMWTGLINVITKGRMITGFPDVFRSISQYMIFGWIPSIAVWFILAIIIGHFIMSKTYFGRYVYALGGNRDAARLAGINVVKINIITHAVGGIFVGGSAILLLSRTMSMSPNSAGTFTFDAIVAACLGGIILSGGNGKITQAILGVCVLNVLFNGLTIIGVGDFWQQFIRGVVMLFSIGILSLQMYVKVDMSESAPKPEPDNQKIKL